MQQGDGEPSRREGVAVVVTVVEALQRDLAVIAKVAPELAESTLAASALALAREIDTAENSATSKSMCARALVETLDKLRALVPEQDAGDGVDELGSRRARRIAKVAS